MRASRKMRLQALARKGHVEPEAVLGVRDFDPADVREPFDHRLR